METEKLKKSVVAAVHPSFWRRNAVPALIITTIVACVTSIGLYAEASYAEGRWDYYQKRAQAKQMIKNPQCDMDSHDRDLHQVMGLSGDEGYREADVFQLSTPAWVDVNRACRKDPSSLYIAPEAIVSDRWINIQNPEPLRNDVGVWFGPGDICKVGNGGWFRPMPADDGDRYILRVEYQRSNYYAAEACPNGSYILALANNKIVHNAVFRGCFQRTKFRQIGLVH